MPRTLIVTNDFPPRIGGIESFIEEIARLLDDDVAVYTSGPPGASGTDQRRAFPVVRDGSMLLPNRATSRRAIGLLRHFGASRVVFGAAAPLGLMAPTLRAAGAERIVALTHGHEVWWASVPAARQMLHRIAEGCDHLTTISAYTERRIAPALSLAARSRILRLAPPIDGERFCPSTSSEPGSRGMRCVATGRFVTQKGFLTLVRAWRGVLENLGSGPAAPQLILIGDGPLRNRIERLTRDLRLTQHVHLTGALPREQVVTQLQNATVFALPVRTRFAGLNPEGLGLAAIEAAACGLPVLIGGSGGAPETVLDQQSGYVLDARDHRAWTTRIVQLLSEPDIAATMGIRGRAYVLDRFGIDQARSTLLSALRL